MDVEQRAAAHAALGDPTRLAIADRLSVTDLAPSEIGEAFGLPSNLVAHHLKVLEAAGVIDRVRSESDGRRSYVRLRRGQPWLDGALAPSPLLPLRPRRVLFVCTRNSARSQLAAAYWAEVSNTPAASAGTEPAARVHPTAVRLGRRHGLDLRQAPTAAYADSRRRSDLVVAVCDHVHESLPADQRLHWSVPDPVATEDEAVFASSLDDLMTRIDRLAPALDPTH